MKVKSESADAQSCLTLSDPMDCSLPGSSIHGIFQARVLEWGAIAFSAWKCEVKPNPLGWELRPFLVASFVPAPHALWPHTTVLLWLSWCLLFFCLLFLFPAVSLLFPLYHGPIPALPQVLPSPFGEGCKSFPSTAFLASLPAETPRACGLGTVVPLAQYPQRTVWWAKAAQSVCVEQQMCWKQLLLFSS